MWWWPLLRRSVSLHWRMSLVGFEYFFSFSHYFRVLLLRSLCNFLRVEPIFRGLLLCWSMFCWFGCCFRSSFLSLPQQIWGINWCHLPIIGLPFALLVLYFELNSGFHSAAFISHLSLSDVAVLSASLHFIFCESCSSIESSHFPSFPWLPLSFKCSLPNPILQFLQHQSLRHCHSRMTRRCPGHCERQSFVRLHFHHYCYPSR